MSTAHRRQVHEVGEAACGRPAVDEGVRCPTLSENAEHSLRVDSIFTAEMPTKQAEQCMNGPAADCHSVGSEGGGHNGT